jgi:hypothetical protein
MKSKQDIRKQLEAGVAVFLSEGKHISKLPTYGGKKKPKQLKEEMVEIEVEYLPVALQKKYFAE